MITNFYCWSRLLTPPPDDNKTPSHYIGRFTKAIICTESRGVHPVPTEFILHNTVIAELPWQDSKERIATVAFGGVTVPRRLPAFSSNPIRLLMAGWFADKVYLQMGGFFFSSRLQAGVAIYLLPCTWNFRPLGGFAHDRVRYLFQIFTLGSDSGYLSAVGGWISVVSGEEWHDSRQFH